MKKRISVLLLSVCALLSVAAQQNEGINFIKAQPFENVMKAARAQKKNIFVDCFAVWCGPCKLLGQKTFPLKEVGDFFNDKFICIQYDVEKGDGVSFFHAYKSHIPGLPTMLVISPEGKVIHSVVGFREGKALIADITKGLQGKSLSALQEKYDAGERSIDFMKDYLGALKDAYKKKEMEAVSKAYLANLPVEALMDPDIWNMAKDYISNPYSSDYQFVINNSYNIKYKMKENSVMLDRQMSRGMDRAVNRLLPSLEKKNVLQATLDSMNILRKLLLKNELLDSKTWLAKFEIAKMKREDRARDLNEYLKFAKSLQLFYWDRMYLRGIYQYLNGKIDDKSVYTEWLTDLNELQKLENASPLPVNFYGLIADLNTKLGNSQEASDAKVKFEKLEIINNEKVSKFYEIFNQQ